MRLRASGKHVKPSAAPTLIAAGGLTAAFAVADAGALAGPAAASASDAQWDRLASCESGGNWHINTGNGYYGGVQFDLGTWRSVGGSGLPSDASREEQIRRANILHDARGWAPWPACSRRMGLVGGSSSSSASSASSASSGDQAAASGDRGQSRASRSRVRAEAVPRAVPITGKYQASRRASVVVALSTATPPRFDGHVLSAADVATYRMTVKQWQRRMAARGWSLAVDGHFGPQSASIARQFAAQKGLRPAVPGTVDAAVWNAAWTLPVA